MYEKNEDENGLDVNDAAALYLTAAESAAALVRHPGVAQAWDEASALARMTVGALAAHLAKQILGAVELLAKPASSAEALPLVEHFARAAWIGADLDDEVSVFVQGAADMYAPDGAQDLAVRTDAALDQVRALIADRPADWPVPIPTGWSLTRDDYFRTRILEVVVHSDDLAYSIGIPTPDLPAAVTGPVLDTLVRIAARRHGAVAVLRGLARSERAPESICAF